MKRRLLAIILSLAFLLAVPVVSLGSSTSDDDAPQFDARLDGYKEGNLSLKEASGNGMTWAFLFILGAVCIGVMFMNSKRTHLD